MENKEDRLPQVLAFIVIMAMVLGFIWLLSKGASASSDIERYRKNVVTPIDYSGVEDSLEKAENATGELETRLHSYNNDCPGLAGLRQADWRYDRAVESIRQAQYEIKLFKRPHHVATPEAKAELKAKSAEFKDRIDDLNELQYVVGDLWILIVAKCEQEGVLL